MIDVRKLSLAEVLKLHKDLQELFAEMRTAAIISANNGARSKPSTLIGKKVPPKYKGPNGETWAGRGAIPNWLVAAMKKTGRKRDSFLIK